MEGKGREEAQSPSIELTGKPCSSGPSGCPPDSNCLGPTACWCVEASLAPSTACAQGILIRSGHCSLLCSWGTGH